MSPMNPPAGDSYLDLLAKLASSGLDASEQEMLDQLAPGKYDDELLHLEIAAAAVGVAGAEREEMPAHLYSRVAASADSFFDTLEQNKKADTVPAKIISPDEVFTDRGGRSWLGWLGWAVAAAALIALSINLWSTRTRTAVTETARQNTPAASPAAVSPAEAREEFLKTAGAVVAADWTPGNVKSIGQVSGDVVWSDEKQAGYLRLKGLPPNEPSKETYQLWIFDKTQDKATPIDGGTFDVPSSGEIVVPIDAKLRAHQPEMFAVTIEKPGGVVVSKREKIAALAKVESRSS